MNCDIMHSDEITDTEGTECDLIIESNVIILKS